MDCWFLCFLSVLSPHNTTEPVQPPRYAVVVKNLQTHITGLIVMVILFFFQGDKQQTAYIFNYFKKQELGSQV